MLSARTKIVAGMAEEAPDEASEALQLFQWVKDAKGEQLTMSLLDHLREENITASGSRRAKMPVGAIAETGAAAPKQEVSGQKPAGASSAVANLMANEEFVTQQIQEVTKKLIGTAGDLELEKPLMEAG